ncbi:hypothetical protein MAPG_03842 [Magnaporthiopsis poae ATCC 64411]|uniref:Uncharacterized protein n=1 Tax=Magnaporthiopsis poae (strain ATCC 64411 / 73-15) TaxID=644358 RepID=A0A0C4DV42_MAGP6|nr:hypothetical protein MAPG_03842 [Magnaporthiopsis poae ATCC 64411]
MAGPYQGRDEARITIGRDLSLSRSSRFVPPTWYVRRADAASPSRGSQLEMLRERSELTELLHYIDRAVDDLMLRAARDSQARSFYPRIFGRTPNDMARRGIGGGSPVTHHAHHTAQMVCHVCLEEYHPGAGGCKLHPSPSTRQNQNGPGTHHDTYTSSARAMLQGASSVIADTGPSRYLASTGPGTCVSCTRGSSTDARAHRRPNSRRGPSFHATACCISSLLCCDTPSRYENFPFFFQWGPWSK